MQQRKKKNGTLRFKYAKISMKNKVKFLRKIVYEGYSIRDASTVFNINYSTAKTLLRQHKAGSLGFQLGNFENETPQHNFNQIQIRSTYKILQLKQGQKHDYPSTQNQFYLSKFQKNPDMPLSPKLSSDGVSTINRQIEVISTIAGA